MVPVTLTHSFWSSVQITIIIIIIIIIIGIYKAPRPKVCPRALYKQNGPKND